MKIFNDDDEDHNFGTYVLMPILLFRCFFSHVVYAAAAAGCRSIILIDNFFVCRFLKKIWRFKSSRNNFFCVLSNFAAFKWNFPCQFQ